MSVEIRPATAAEMGDMGILGGYVYGGSFGDGPDNTVATANLPDWTLCAFVDGKMASSFTNIPFTMRANGSAMPLAGVSTIGTQPEYRRQGLVRRIHTEAFERMHEAGQPMAALWASQAAIYQRYGYALTTMLRQYSVDTADIRFFDGNEGSGDVRRIPVEDAYDTVKRIYIAYIANRICYLHRAKALWLQNALEPNEAEGPIWVAVSYDAAGAEQGYVIYTLAGRQGGSSRPLAGNRHPRPRVAEPRRLALAVELPRPPRPRGPRALERCAAGRTRPGVLLRAKNARHTVDREGAWYRVVDAPKALAGRGYGQEGEITLALADDPLASWNDGAWKVETGGEGAHVTRSAGRPDLTLDAKALSSLWCGRHSASRLCAAGDCWKETTPRWRERTRSSPRTTRRIARTISDDDLARGVETQSRLKP